MKCGGGDLAKKAWSRNEVGIWYGKWSARGWYAARNKLDYLKKQSLLAHQCKKSNFDVATRFADILNSDWVVMFFEDRLYLCQIRGRMKSRSNHPLNRDSEIFKYRKIVTETKRSFNLAELSDSYRLIPSAGRANVHQFGNTGKSLIGILTESKDANEANKMINKLPFLEWLDLLGDAGWESFCEGYLILEDSFVPTGLSAGRTLPIVDIIGRNRRIGDPVVAQCKKNPTPIQVHKKFLETCEDIRKGHKNARCYFFSYGGCTNPPKWLKVVDCEYVKRWIKTRTGKKYANLWRRR